MQALVFLQVCSITRCKVTLITFDWFHPIVFDHMNSQASFLKRSKFTLAAFERLLSIMGPHVNSKVIWRGMLTDGALVHLFFAVRPFMYFQFRWLICWIVALGTFQNFIRTTNTAYCWEPNYTTSSGKASGKEIPIGIPYRILLFPYREFPIGTLVWLFSQTKIPIGNPYRDCSLIIFSS